MTALAWVKNQQIIIIIINEMEKNSKKT